MKNRRAPLTDGQQRIYGFIREFIEEHYYPPTIREIRDNFHLKSNNSVVVQLKELKEKGYITNASVKGKMTARTIQLVDEIIRVHSVNSDQLSKALANLKQKGYNIGAAEAVELLSALNIKIEK